jgi:hypothetical protein
MVTERKQQKSYNVHAPVQLDDVTMNAPLTSYIPELTSAVMRASEVTNSNEANGKASTLADCSS